MLIRNLLAVAFLLSLTSQAEAAGRRRSSGWTSSPVQSYRSVPEPVGEAIEALDEVNAKRATRGLRPYIFDEALTKAAIAAAKFRASHRIFGHVQDTNLGDFRFLPPGVSAASAGCAAYPPSYGWMSCDIWESNTYAGAAWVMGRDGRRFMHIFVR